MFSCPRVRDFKKTGVTSVICHSPLCRLERQVVGRIWLCVSQKTVLVCLYFLRRAADNDKAPATVGAHSLEAQVAEGPQLLADTVADEHISV